MENYTIDVIRFPISPTHHDVYNGSLDSMEITCRHADYCHSNNDVNAVALSIACVTLTRLAQSTFQLDPFPHDAMFIATTKSHYTVCFESRGTKRRRLRPTADLGHAEHEGRWLSRHLVHEPAVER